jgi:hypothetical protein
MLDKPPQTFRNNAMTSTLTIKDLSLDKELDRKDMAAVRGGLANQGNAGQQSNFLAMFAPVSVANGASFSGPVNIQVDSFPTQTANNDSTSSNHQGAWDEGYPDY